MPDAVSGKPAICSMNNGPLSPPRSKHPFALVQHIRSSFRKASPWLLDDVTMSSAPPLIIGAPNSDAAPPATVIFLHGFGDDAHGWTGMSANHTFEPTFHRP